MLPLCSAAPCSSLSQIFLNDGFRCHSRSRKLFGICCFSRNNALSNFSTEIGLPGVSLQKDAANSLHSEFVGRLRGSLSMGRDHLKYVEDSVDLVSKEEQVSDVLVNNTDILLDPSSNESVSILDKIAERTLNLPDALDSTSNESVSIMDKVAKSTSNNESISIVDKVVESTTNVPDSLDLCNNESVSILDKVAESTANIPDALDPSNNESVSILDKVAKSTANIPGTQDLGNNESVSILDKVAESTANVPDALGPSNNESASILDKVAESVTDIREALKVDSDSLPTSPETVESFISEGKESISASINKGTDAINSSFEGITSTIKEILNDGNKGIENLISKVLSSVDQTGELTRDKLVSLPNSIKEVSGKAGIVAIDLLRQTIVVTEESLAKGAKFVYYSYESSKGLLPPEIQITLDSIEEKAGEISRPVGIVVVQVYSAIEGLERSLGLDPSDPIVPFTLLLGTTSALWAVYWVVTYGGYAGELSPKLAYELLSGKDDAVLIDVRPEDLRERDGIPDLRRAARFRYAHVSIPEVEGSVRKLMNNSKDLDDTLVAAVIRNLKIVRDSSKVIVMDADGSRAKGIARSLRKLGIKRPFVLHGGFQSWAKEELRIKELKPETAITILSEEAEAILEEFRPSPVQIVGIGVGAVAALYALVEWEKTLQIIGILGLAQTIYRRVASYENSEDLWKDVGVLLSPVKVGAQAVSLVAAKGDTNGNGLPVSPSSSDVQNRVLQAAAKHESQPSDEGSQQDTLLDSTSSITDNVDLTEA